MGVRYCLVGIFSLALQAACIPAQSARGSEQRTANILLREGLKSVTTSVLPLNQFCMKLAKMGMGRLLPAGDWVEGSCQEEDNKRILISL